MLHAVAQNTLAAYDAAGALLNREFVKEATLYLGQLSCDARAPNLTASSSLDVSRALPPCDRLPVERAPCATRSSRR